MTDITTEQIIEAMARAIYDAHEIELDQEWTEFDDLPEDWVAEWRELAAAALDAALPLIREAMAEAVLVSAAGIKEAQIAQHGYLPPLESGIVAGYQQAANLIADWEPAPTTQEGEGR